MGSHASRYSVFEGKKGSRLFVPLVKSLSVGGQIRLYLNAEIT